MMSTGMRTFFQSGIQKNLKSRYESFVPQNSLLRMCVQTGRTGKTSFFLIKTNKKVILSSNINPRPPKVFFTHTLTQKGGGGGGE